MKALILHFRSSWHLCHGSVEYMCLDLCLSSIIRFNRCMWFFCNIIMLFCLLELFKILWNHSVWNIQQCSFCSGCLQLLQLFQCHKNFSIDILVLLILSVNTSYLFIFVYLMSSIICVLQCINFMFIKLYLFLFDYFVASLGEVAFFYIGDYYIDLYYFDSIFCSYWMCILIDFW